MTLGCKIRSRNNSIPRYIRMLGASHNPISEHLTYLSYRQIIETHLLPRYVRSVFMLKRLL
jgi:hypothetical protein